MYELLKLIKALQECSDIKQADPILTRLGAGPAVKKLVETALILSNSQDPQQRNHAYAFMESAIRELEEVDHSVDKKFHDEHKVSEEELDNHNNGSREDGSEQSSENKEPYSGPAKDSTNGEKAMQDMDGTTNQWNETGPGMMPNGMAPQPMQQNGPGMIVPGLAPDIAQEMGSQMPTPQLNQNQMMRQMQYTAQEIAKSVVKEMVGPVIQKLERKITETRTPDRLELDVNKIKENAPARFRETTSSMQDQINGSVQPRTTKRREHTAKARHEIEQMDKILNSENNPLYN
jgi:hypothetical protein